MQPLVTGEKTLPVRPGMFLETVSKVVLHFAFCVEWFALKPSGPKIPLSYKIFSPLENFTIGKPALFYCDIFSHIQFLLNTLIVTLDWNVLFLSMHFKLMFFNSCLTRSCLVYMLELILASLHNTWNGYILFLSIDSQFFLFPRSMSCDVCTIRRNYCMV